MPADVFRKAGSFGVEAFSACSLLVVDVMS